MLFKGTFGSQFSGSLGGVTAAHNRSGGYLRARVIPVNPNTTFQQTVRNIQGNLATSWVTTLTQIQRDAWDLYGDNVAMLNRTGDTIFLTGLNHFVRTNVPRIQVGIPRQDDAPTVFALTDVTLPGMVVSFAGQTATVTYNNADEWAITDDGFLSLALSRPANPTINYFKGPYRFADVELGNTATPPTSPLVSALPFPVALGQKVFAFIRGETSTGRLSQGIRLGAVVGA